MISSIIETIINIRTTSMSVKTVMKKTVFLPGLKGGKVLISEKGTFVRGLSC